MTLSTGKVIWIAFKWLVVPGALGAVGYYVIGPRIGQVPALEAGAEKVRQIVQREPEASSPSEPTQVESEGGPEVEIAVEKAERRPRTRRRSTSSSTTTRRSSNPTPPAPRRPEGEQADPASGSGAIPPTGGEATPPPATTGEGAPG